MTTSFPIAPAPSASWVLALVAIPLVLVLVGAIGLMGASVVGARTARFEVDAGGIKLRGDLYGRTIPRSSIRMDGVRMVDLDGEPTLRPTRRTFGTALPGYRSGWFRLADGEKALLYVTDRSKVVYVPTTQGFALLLSPADPRGFVASLRAPAP